MPKKAKKEVAGRAGTNKKGNQTENKSVATVNIKTKGNLKDKNKTRKESGERSDHENYIHTPKRSKRQILIEESEKEQNETDARFIEGNHVISLAVRAEEECEFLQQSDLNDTDSEIEIETDTQGNIDKTRIKQVKDVSKEMTNAMVM